MKKFLLLMLFVASTLYAQSLDTSSVLGDDLRNFSIDVDTMVLRDADAFKVNFNDPSSKDWSEVRFNVSSILTFLEYQGYAYGLDLDDLTDANITYIWDKSTICMNDAWLKLFFESNESDKRNMISELLRK